MQGTPRELIEQALPVLDRAAGSKRATELTEADLQGVLADLGGAAEVSLSLKHWPAVGPTDVVLEDGTGIEIQWCISGDTLAGCAWDIAKLAAAIAEHKLNDGWIIAVAPTWHWQTRRPGVELFRECDYQCEELIEDYEDWWRLWCNEVMSRPTHLPRSFALADPGEIADARIGRVPFTIRYARVVARASTWTPYVCPHHWRDRRCLPRPWDPDGTGEIVAPRESERLLAHWSG